MDSKKLEFELEQMARRTCATKCVYVAVSVQNETRGASPWRCARRSTSPEQVWNSSSKAARSTSGATDVLCRVSFFKIRPNDLASRRSEVRSSATILLQIRGTIPSGEQVSIGTLCRLCCAAPARILLPNPNRHLAPEPRQPRAVLQSQGVSCQRTSPRCHAQHAHQARALEDVPMGRLHRVQHELAVQGAAVVCRRLPHQGLQAHRS
mmetsp:Transcript_156350/g.501606  ORF Transcript_156350/g.501606 Transcript_156350/m.501606 type:complete len:208 (-) Transcript_156350:24-647(-)